MEAGLSSTPSAAKARRKAAECMGLILSGLRRNKDGGAAPDYLGGNRHREWQMTVVRLLARR